MFVAFFSPNPRMIIEIVAVAGTIFGFLFLTLSIASGLYYLSELVEEHTIPAKRFLTRSIYTVITILTLLLLLDHFPFKLTLFSIVSHAVYYKNLGQFPLIRLSSPSFILSCILLLSNHILWFKHFNNAEVQQQQELLFTGAQRRYSFSEVASFFAICVWFVPFALFVSLSAGDYVLPQTTADGSTGANGGNHGEDRSKKRRTVGLARFVVDKLRAFAGFLLGLVGVRRRRGGSDYDGGDGLVM